MSASEPNVSTRNSKRWKSPKMSSTSTRVRDLVVYRHLLLTAAAQAARWDEGTGGRGGRPYPRTSAQRAGRVRGFAAGASAISSATLSAASAALSAASAALSAASATFPVTASTVSAWARRK